jgi:ferritin-like metal-binding protein YciE
MRGLIEEGGEAASDGRTEEPLTDLAIIAAAQRVEHYEISGYGSARAIAMQLGNETVASLLEETSEEEKAADTKLNEIAADLLTQAGDGNMSAEDEEEEEEVKPARKTSKAGSASRRAARG